MTNKSIDAAEAWKQFEDLLAPGLNFGEPPLGLVSYPGHLSVGPNNTAPGAATAPRLFDATVTRLNAKTTVVNLTDSAAGTLPETG